MHMQIDKLEQFINYQEIVDAFVIMEKERFSKDKAFSSTDVNYIYDFVILKDNEFMQYMIQSYPKMYRYIANSLTYVSLYEFAFYRYVIKYCGVFDQRFIYNTFLSLFDTFSIGHLKDFNSYFTFYMNHLNQFISENNLFVIYNSVINNRYYMIKHSSLYKVLKDQNLDNYSYIKKFIETIKNEH